MTIVGSKRMIVYDDVAQQEKIKVFDTRVERPPHYDTFAEFHYAYHYGDMYVPYIKQEEPLKAECQHFIDCIRSGAAPLTNGERGLELVRILEAASQSIKNSGAPVDLTHPPAKAGANGNGHGNGDNGSLTKKLGRASPLGRTKRKPASARRAANVPASLM
jgi:hypothetical protein